METAPSPLTATRATPSALPWRKFFRENSLSLALFGVFFLSLAGQTFAGLDQYNEELQQHGEVAVELGSYLTSGHYLEAVFENWESEFLQMAAYVLFTVSLRQKGSPDSKPLGSDEDVDGDPRQARVRPGVPWPVRRGGFILKLYENSLGLALALLFVLSFSLHAIGGAMAQNQEQRWHGETDQVSVLTYVTTSKFWFESFQNWQSEFFSLGTMIVLSIYLRQRGSPESKPVDAPHEQTGR